MRVVISGKRGMWGVRGAVLGSLALALSACSGGSTKHGGTATTHQRLISAQEEEGPKVPPDVLNMGHFNRKLHVRGLSLLTKGKRRAAAIQLFDVKALQANVPVLIHVTGPMRTLIYSSGGAQIDPSLQHIGVLLPHRDTWWVNDQIPTAWLASGFSVRVGTGTTPNPRSLPDLTTTGVKLEQNAGLDTVSGTLVSRSVGNVRYVVISAVVLQQQRVIAAGRTVVRGLPSKPARTPFQISMVSETKETGRVELSAVPMLG